MTYPDPAPAVSWRVTSQMETAQVNDAGVAVQGVRVFYLTGTGQSGSVFVPKTSYTPDRVTTLIAAAAANSDQVGQLSQGMAGQ